MPINPDVAIGAALPEQTFDWTVSDVLLYHLALGAGAKAVDPGELRYTYERDLRVLPSFAVVAPTFHQHEPPKVSFPGIEIDLASVLHGRQELTIHQPIPAEGSGVSHTRIADVFDKGKAAVIVQETEVADLDGAPLWTARSTIFARGAGGFGGNRGPSDRPELPDRAPDAVLTTPTLPQQALWYRLCGDRNPLHVDPEFAAGAGFPAPILHGLCSYGLVCKALVDHELDGETARVGGYRVRFAGVVYPGETLRTRLWREAGQILAATTVVERDDASVLSDVVLTVK